jgi:hypothetical protein
MSRDRLTITLDEALLTAVDGTIDGSAVRNRSHAIEHLIRKGLLLHELTTLVIVPGAGTENPPLPALAEAIKATSIIQCMIVSDPTRPTWATELSISLQTLIPHLTMRIVPGDFGSAAGLTLLADELTAPYLILELRANTQLPPSFLPLYTAHRRTDNYLTLLLQTDNGLDFSPTGCMIMSPEAVVQIPAGRANLADLFPLLVKAGKVGTYVG